MFIGERPSFLPKNRILSQKEFKHYEFLNSYVNPIMRAKGYAEMFRTEGITKNQLAQRLGISRVRVTQMLKLLNLPQKQQDYILKHGKEEMITERKLRNALSG